MSEATKSAVIGLSLAVLTLLVSLGVIGSDSVDTWQAVVVSVVTLIGTLGVRSLRPPLPPQE